MRALSKPILVATSLMFFAGAAVAADVAKPVVVVHQAAAVPVWTGFYLGVQLGYGWGNVAYDSAAGPAVGLRPKGVVGGGTAGYNWQTGAFVFGIEGDVSGSGLRAQVRNGIAPCLVRDCTVSLNWLATGRARVGYDFGRATYVSSWMPYITGGVAGGGFDGNADLVACGAATCGFDGTHWGWTAGGGVEWKFPGHWSAKLEYLYVNLGAPSFTSSNVRSSDFTANIVRVGLNLPLP